MFGFLPISTLHHLAKRNPFTILIGIVMILTILPASALYAGPHQELTVSAAASLKNSFEEIGRLFESQRDGVKVSLNFASSGDLATQIMGGAPVDVFASAAEREMDNLEAKALTVPGTRCAFAQNSIVLAQPVKSPVKIGSFVDLKGTQVKLISIGNPATVPAGLYAEEALHYFGLWNDIKGKMVFGESVRQVLDYIAHGEVDAGIVFSTDARIRPNDLKVIASAPAGSHRPIIYPIAVVKESKQENLARDFIGFIVSEEGRKVLEKYGFKPAQ
ncbi:MAG: molybdate ABC transporter substrate-binding protein [Syntrophobacteraceae bacterium]